jgi:hypothetical protein
VVAQFAVVIKYKVKMLKLKKEKNRNILSEMKKKKKKNLHGSVLGLFYVTVCNAKDTVTAYYYSSYYLN